MMMKEKVLKVFSYFIFTLLLLIVVGCNKEEAPLPEKEILRPVKTRTIQINSSNSENKEFSGVAESDESSILSFRVSGVIQQMKSEVGDKVKKGNIIAILDKRDYLLRVKDLEGQLTSAQAQFDQLIKGARTEEVRIADNKIKSLESTLKTAELEYRRVQQLYANDAASKSRLDQAKNNFDKVRLDLKSANEEYVIATHGGREEEIRAQKFKIESIKSNLDQANANLKDTNLKAPFDGELSIKHVSNFERVSAGQKIYTLVDINFIEFQISIPERWISKIKKGQTAKIKFLNFPNETFEGWVDKIGVVADSATLTYPVFVKLKNLKNKILPGMSATIYLVLKGLGEEYPTLPIHAIIEKPGTENKMVWVLDPTNNTVSERQIRIGEISSDEIEIIDGLVNGDQIVVAGTDRMREGMKVLSN